MAEIGGTYGLAAGISIMTIFEFFEFVGALLVYLLFKLCSSNRSSIKVSVYETREVEPDEDN